jgi:hypothetical protein
MKKFSGRAATGALSALALLLVPAASASAVCPNEALRVNATALPGCMALELVSPPKKDAQPAFLPSFSRDGERLQMKIEAALAGTRGYQHFGGDTYVSSCSS